MTYFLDLTAAYVLALVYAGLCVVVAELIVYGPRWPRLERDRNSQPTGSGFVTTGGISSTTPAAVRNRGGGILRNTP
jgi:hypothetical protein